MDHETISCLIDEVFGSLQDPITRKYVGIDGLHQTNHHDDWSEHRQHLRNTVFAVEDKLQ